jgi:YbbR domain-containing protein
VKRANRLNKLRAAFTANLGLKAISLAAAVFLVAYQRSQEDERTRTVAFGIDVQLPEADSRKELMTPIPPDIKVTVQGSLSALEELSGSSNTLELDLRSANVEHVAFAPEQLKLPPGIRIKAIEPSSIDLEWQNIVEREVPIQTTVAGEVAAGHELARATAMPETTTLAGPEKVVGVVQSVRVAPFDLTGLSTGVYERQLALEPAPNRMTYVGPTTVTVSVNVRRHVVTASFSKLVVQVVGGGTAIEVLPGSVDVSVKGAPEVVHTLQPELIVPRVDVTGFDTTKHGSAALPVVVDLSRVEVVTQPPTVKVSW